ncbi:hypothetical protein FRC01_001318 [Tulasnella sp. 417]|nr:hypothetical protein FRC01_001318 [Tulasnella sp. 417]
MSLPPLKPKLRSGTRVLSARQSNTSPRPRTTQTCNILVTNANNGNIFGYISPVWNTFGTYGFVQSTQAGALEVSFSYPQDDFSPSQLDITAVNGPNASYPFFGAGILLLYTSSGPLTASAVKGRANADASLGPGSYHHSYIVGTTQIPAGSTPQDGDNNSFDATTGFDSPAESAIWIYDPVTQELTAQWINPHGSTPANYIVYANSPQDPIFVITGDVAAFQAIFAPYPPVVSSD